MLDEKTNEVRQDEQPASVPVKTRREKIRSRWAQIQCSNLLRRHRFRRRTQNHMNNFSAKIHATPALLALGGLLYALGFSAEYAFVRFGRAVKRVALQAKNAVVTFFHDLAIIAFPGAAQAFREVFGPIYLFFRGIGSLLIHADAIRKKEGLGAAFRASVHYFKSGIRRNIRLLPRMAMYLLPLAAFAILMTVYNGAVTQPYALAVRVNGETVGYVANEDVFNSARDDVQQRINYSGTEKTE